LLTASAFLLGVVEDLLQPAWAAAPPVLEEEACADVAAVVPVEAGPLNLDDSGGAEALREEERRGLYNWCW
jgi:hypothetical protein